MGNEKGVGHFDRRFMDQVLGWRTIVAADVDALATLQALPDASVINGCDTRFAWDNALHLFVRLPATVTSCTISIYMNNRCKADFDSGLRETNLTVLDHNSWYKLKTYDDVTESSVITIQDFPVGGLYILVSNVVTTGAGLNADNPIILDYHIAR